MTEMQEVLKLDNKSNTEASQRVTDSINELLGSTVIRI